MSMLRKDPISNGWVIMLEDQSISPRNLEKRELERSEPVQCPFCEGREEMTPPEIAAYRGPDTSPNAPGWRVRTVPNQFAVLRVEGELNRRPDGIYDVMNGVGAHEVIIETPDHSGRMGEFTGEKMTEILRMYRDRTRDLRKDGRMRYVQMLRNYGLTTGSSLAHPHSQLVALPITPRWVKEELVCAKEHWQLKERCLFCDILTHELSVGDRIVFENDSFVSLAPFASKFPFETWILPRRHAAEFDQLADEEIAPLGEALNRTLWAIQRALDDPPYNYIIHSAPRLSLDRYARSAISIDRDYHWHIEIIPRITRMAGFEWGTGFYVNPTLPENAAEYLRAILADDAA
jgi:UDPglucose--hexose-1-phosphate uridylyltransferase